MTLEKRPTENPDKASQVKEMFNRIADSYDLLNDCISLGMHRQWKKKACDYLQLKPGDHVLDVCTGTGDLTGHLIPLVEGRGEVMGVDFSEEMLEIARQRFVEFNNINFEQGDAMALPFEDNRFDGAIVSFGLRNVSDIEQAISEMARVVKPGGWVVNLDTSPDVKTKGYWFYFNHVMPKIGGLVSKDPKAYGYLAKSTQQFISPAKLSALFEKVGLTNIQTEALALESVSIQAGQKQ